MEGFFVKLNLLALVLNSMFLGAQVLGEYESFMPTWLSLVVVLFGLWAAIKYSVTRRKGV